AHDDLADLLGLQAGAGHALADRDRADLGRLQRGETALEPADRRACAGQDDRACAFLHGSSVLLPRCAAASGPLSPPGVLPTCRPAALRRGVAAQSLIWIDPTSPSSIGSRPAPDERSRTVYSVSLSRKHTRPSWPPASSNR